MDNKAIGERLRKLRKSKISPATGRPLSTAELAAALKISDSLIRYMERGTKSLVKENKDKYVEYFKCYPEYITGEKEYPDPAHELLAQVTDTELLRQDAWIALCNWIQSALPGDLINKIDLFEIYDHIFGLNGYVDEKIQEVIGSSERNYGISAGFVEGLSVDSPDTTPKKRRKKNE